MNFWLSLLILIVYLVFLGLFVSGYRHTTFSRSPFNIIFLSLLWPVLLIVYPRFRRNFRRALERDSML